jgi:hypothetical protein
MHFKKWGQVCQSTLFLVSGELQPHSHQRNVSDPDIWPGNRCLMHFLMIIYAPYICKTWIHLDLKSRRLFFDSTGAMAVAIRWKRP